MSESRISVEEAALIIRRCTDRMTLLLEIESVNEGLRSWGKTDSEERRRTTTNPLSGLVFTSLMDLKDVYGRNFPEHAAWWVKEKMHNFPEVEWTGPDLSCELCRPMEELDFLCDALGNLSFNHSSEAAARGAFAVVRDVQEQLLQTLSALEQSNAKQCA